jgi:hypothetical protein
MLLLLRAPALEIRFHLFIQGATLAWRPQLELQSQRVQQFHSVFQPVVQVVDHVRQVGDSLVDVVKPFIEHINLRLALERLSDEVGHSAPLECPANGDGDFVFFVSGLWLHAHHVYVTHQFSPGVPQFFPLSFQRRQRRHGWRQMILVA